MKPLLFAMAATPGLAENICRLANLEAGELEHRRFPDGESYVRYLTPPKDRDVILLSALSDPDARTLPLLFAAGAARRYGARSVGLASPYLPYLRQDKAFLEGEAVTSGTYARLLSDAFDWLLTVDPHLHRYPSLDSIYSVATSVATAGAEIAKWISAEVGKPFIVGPDSESAQWIDRVAQLAHAPFAVFEKVRSGDDAVRISGEAFEAMRGRTPVVVDDIASSAATLIECAHLLIRLGQEPPVCAVVHPIFAGDAYERLMLAGVQRVVSANTIYHPSNAIDISSPLATAIVQMLEQMAGGTRQKNGSA